MGDAETDEVRHCSSRGWALGAARGVEQSVIGVLKLRSALACQ
ncbi:MAG TPA: hypothetical protein VEC10_10320 [Steroidobacteraceae bacterium]|nr:hypothetical protein [Steroidobacteraceae bacterium]